MKNKKKTIYLIALLLITTTLFVGCSDNMKPENQNVDYSQYSFVNTSWTRDAEHDIETIRFGADGKFMYYCACGNPEMTQICARVILTMILRKLSR